MRSPPLPDPMPSSLPPPLLPKHCGLLTVSSGLTVTDMILSWRGDGGRTLGGTEERMRAFSWVPLLGLLAALAAAQENKPTRSTVIHLFGSPLLSVQSRNAHLTPQSRLESVVDGERVVTQEEAVVEEASHKTADASPSGILETVQKLVASAVSPLTSDSVAAEETEVEGSQLNVNPAPVEEVEDDRVTEEQVVPTNPSEPEEAPTVFTNQNEEEAPVESNNNKNKNNVKLVGVYNEVVDNVIDVLSSSLSKVGPLPIELSDDVKLTALDAAEATPEPEPEPEPTDTKGNKNKTRKETRNKNKRKNKNKNRKNKRKGEMSDDEDSERKNNKKIRKNKNKNKGVNNEEEEEVEEEVKVKPTNKGNKKRNKNKNKNKRNKRRNTKKNKKRNKSEGIEVSRDGRAMSEDEDVEDESVTVGQARRKYPERKNKGNKKNKRRRNNKNKKNRKNKNKKNANKNSDAQEKESRADPGPVYPSPEELSNSNAYITGLSTISRVGDVTVENTGKALLVNAKVQVGPMFVQLANAARALTKSQVSTLLEADMQFKVRSKGRGRKLIKLNSVTMGGPSEISVARLDLPLEPEVVLAAQDEVLNALDVSRVGRIFEMELEKIFEEDNVVQNLESHPLLKK
ncbi:chitin biosynthesis protein CHS5-like isoform X2 [Portunus trituberculatus]|uniref:chitin biosynthesis protein CHS5-like isoform X2 n=1 Tax=Portunus trituberculatus TaxID=210409 RepID=UPI001E1CD88C|nr:chitin biosynthesis protein CHS5-like isoform X2 [Portunus trituberculatus]